MSGDGPFFGRVLVLGLGLLGGSFAQALRGAGLAGSIQGCDTEETHARLALELGFADALWEPQAAPEPFDLVFVAVPPGQVGTALASLGPWLHANSMIMDACSVKASVARAMVDALGPHPGLLPAHPIAGGHTAGPAQARGGLFSGAPVVLSPLPCTSLETLAQGRALWSDLGGRVVEMEPGEHDRQLALLSHLPHLLAYTTVSLAAESGVNFALTGPGFRDSTRLAQCPVPLWADIALCNGEALGSTLRAFIARLEGLVEALKTKDRVELQRRLHKAREYRMPLEETTAG